MSLKMRSTAAIVGSPMAAASRIQDESGQIARDQNQLIDVHDVDRNQGRRRLFGVLFILRYVI